MDIIDDTFRAVTAFCYVLDDSKVLLFQVGVSVTNGSKTNTIYSQTVDMDKLDDAKDKANSTAMCIVMGLNYAGHSSITFLTIN